MRVIVAYDGSADAEVALSWAVQHAGESQSDLTLLYVDDGMTVLPDEPLTRDDPETAAATLERRASRIREAAPGLQVTSIVREGDVLHSLLRESTPAVLLVVGSGSGGVLHAPARWSLGARLIAHASGPVAIVPSVAGEGRHGVVVGIDGSEESGDLARFAAQLALEAAQPLRIVHAWSPPVMWFNPWPLDPEVLSVVETPHQEFLDAVVDRVGHDFPGITVEGTVTRADSAVALLEVDPPAILTVMGRRSKSVLQKALLGSTGLSVLLNLSTPCLVVPDAALISPGNVS
ncbi:MAG: universal stress protein [Herbiconiux sp.]|uniref:universal stress protein n=1 Tax=Herbiconiux sp. TaxID=1871186 RepID=UPI0011F7D7E7|nr:universal stress protein [Herbiconiux sp.]TAJ48183.1 MAG: universal stress protein [Herbiconiux sp.]